MVEILPCNAGGSGSIPDLTAKNPKHRSNMATNLINTLKMDHIKKKSFLKKSYTQLSSLGRVIWAELKSDAMLRGVRRFPMVGGGNVAEHMKLSWGLTLTWEILFVLENLQLFRYKCNVKSLK